MALDDRFFQLDYTHEEIEDLLDKIKNGYVLTKEEYDKLIPKLEILSTFSGDYNDLINKPNFIEEIRNAIQELNIETSDSVDSKIDAFDSTIKEFIDSGLDSKANVAHTHKITDIAELENALLNKADFVHSHDNYDEAFKNLEDKLNEIEDDFSIDLDNYVTNDVMADALKNKANKTHEHKISDIESLQSSLDDKYNKTETYSQSEIIDLVDEKADKELLENKSDKDHTHGEYVSIDMVGALLDEHKMVIEEGLANELENYVKTDDFESGLSSKADVIHDHNELYYSKQEIDDTIKNIDLSPYAKKEDVDAALATKAEVIHSHDISNINELQNILDDKINKDIAATKEELMEGLSNKSDIEHSHDDVYASIKHEHVVEDITDIKDNFYDKDEIDLALDSKAELEHKHDISEIADLQTELDSKALKDDVYNKDQIDEKMNSKSDVDHDHNDVYYTKQETDEKIDESIGSIDLTPYATIEYVDDELSKKADATHAHELSDINGLLDELDRKANAEDVYNKTEIDDTVSNLNAKIDSKADAGHDHDEVYSKLDHVHETDDITDLFDNVHTKEEIKDLLAEKSDIGHGHKIEEIEELQSSLDLKANVEDVYNKTEIDNTVSDLNEKIDTKADADHDHDDDYAALQHKHGIEDITDILDNFYTETETDDLLAGKSDIGHGHKIPEIEGLSDELGKKADLENVYNKTEINEIVDTINEAIDGKADVKHGHDIAAIEGLQDALDLKADKEDTYTKDDIDNTVKELEEAINSKADAEHDHDDDYAALQHEHIVEEITDLFDNVHTKEEIKNLLAEKSDSDHDHDSVYSKLDHTHLAENITDLYNDIYKKKEIEDFLANKSDSDHGHDEVYAEIVHKHSAEDVTDLYDNIYNKKEIDETLAGKSDKDHIHDMSVITGLADALALKASVEEMNTKASKQELETGLLSKSDTSHKHDDVYAQLVHSHDDLYYTETEVDDLLEKTIDDARIVSVAEANIYTNSAIADLIDSAPDSMNTLKELADAIKEHQDVYDAYVATVSESLSSKSDIGHSHDDTYYTKTEVDEKVFGDLNVSLKDYVKTSDMAEALTSKSDIGHDHLCEDITDLQEILDAKADSINAASKEEFDELKAIVAGKSDTTHNHDGIYATSEHEHTVGDITDLYDNVYSKTNMDSMLAGKASSEHDHYDIHAEKEHTHKTSEITDLYDNVYSINDIDAQMNSKADSTHDHNTIYYTKDEIDEEIISKINAIDHSQYALKTDLSSKADATHSHDISEINDLQTTLDTKINKDVAATKAELTDGLASKADDTHLHADVYLTEEEITTLVSGVVKDANLSQYATLTYVNSELAKKADAEHGHDIAAIEGLQDTLNSKADKTDTYTKDEINTYLAGKADSVHSHGIEEIKNLQGSLDTKANVSDVYTKSDMDSALALKMDSSAREEIDAAIDLKLDKADINVITNEKIDELILDVFDTNS